MISAMKTDTQRLLERLEALKIRQAALRQELTGLDADEQRYTMALDVLRSLGDEDGRPAGSVVKPILRRRPVTHAALPVALTKEVGSLSLAGLITQEVLKDRDGLTTGEIVAAVQKLQPQAKYASIVSVLSRLVHSSGLVRRDGNLVFRTK